MATSKGVIQGYAAQAAVDSSHQIIVAADVIGSGSEQAMLLPMIEQSEPYREDHTLITADAGYHSDANVQLRIPRDGGHDSMLMADSVPASSRTPFHGDGGQHSILKADTPAVS